MLGLVSALSIEVGIGSICIGAGTGICIGVGIGVIIALVIGNGSNFYCLLEPRPKAGAPAINAVDF